MTYNKSLNKNFVLINMIVSGEVVHSRFSEKEELQQKQKNKQKNPTSMTKKNNVVRGNVLLFLG